MTPHEFIRKWKNHALTERASAQEHFLDICRLLGHPTPAEDDPTGERFTFEKGVPKTGGGDGFADVWKRGYFAWEYKKRRRNLDDALVQLVRYASALENPPLQVVCDTIRFKIVTAWTNVESKSYDFEIEQLEEPEKLGWLHSVLHDPEKLKPARTRAKLTIEAANKFQTISDRLQHRHPDREAVAHFINQLVFCFFANSVKLLPEGLLGKLLQTARRRPAQSKQYFDKLFEQMETGGEFDLTDIAHFNGGLFDGRRALPLDVDEIALLDAVSRNFDWSLIDPTIFGTLFERFLDPDKRAQIGAHYTDAEKIGMIVEPVVLRPLRAEWDVAKAEIDAIMTPVLTAEAPTDRHGKTQLTKAFTAAAHKAELRRDAFVDRLTSLRILDPACGSGNFLYLALQGVKDIEHRAMSECEVMGLPRSPLRVGPAILRGIEINPLAAELARTTIWIGHIQWSIKNAVYLQPKPILEKLDAIECRDALIDEAQKPAASSPLVGEDTGGGSHGTGEGSSTPLSNSPPQGGRGPFAEAAWPDADCIVGNPPFLGGKLLRRGLGDATVERLFDVFDGRVPREADLVCYWFMKAWERVKAGRPTRVGLVSTNSIRGGANRKVLDPIAAENAIFEAWSDEPWVVDGAAVRVSLVCFRNPHMAEARSSVSKDEVGETIAQLNGVPVARVNADLTGAAGDVTSARPLLENADVAFMGDTKGGAFDIPGSLAREWLQEPMNAVGRSNSDVLRPWVNGLDVTRRARDMWIIDFGWKMSEAEAAYYEQPFAYVREHVRPARDINRRETYKANWWRHVEPRPAMWTAIKEFLNVRYLATPRVAKHRIFIWQSVKTMPDSRLYAFMREDAFFFGVLQSRVHEIWSLATCSWHGVGNDPTYNNVTCFETFPFPEGLTPNIPAANYADDLRAKRIAAAAKDLDDKRNAWLNPPDLVDIVPEVVPGYPDRILPKNAEAAVKLKERTLTKLYNERPHWLANLHEILDRAVAAAYGWPEDIATDDALAKLLALNLDRAAKGSASPNPAPKRRKKA